MPRLGMTLGFPRRLKGHERLQNVLRTDESRL